MTSNTTIAAIATPAGRGGVSIVRVSGPAVWDVAKAIIGRCPNPRVATLASFKNAQQQTIDQGVALYFAAPHSFTGEDVLELQGHGGPVVMDQLLQAVLTCDVRMAEPGEFSKRAFLNNKLDLAQAEAIADLIDAGSKQAARAAMRSLDGEFSATINELLAKLTELRMFIEVAIDFPDEDIEFIKQHKVVGKLQALLQPIEQVYLAAERGAVLREGIQVAIVGEPNVGKSTLLNALSRRDSAIVTPIAGTTRDLLREYIQIDGIPIHVVDTAGLRDTDDEVERQGIARAKAAMQQADLIIYVTDQDALPSIDTKQSLLVVRNKIDLNAEAPSMSEHDGVVIIALSAKNKHGIDLLEAYLKNLVGGGAAMQDTFSARRRHIDALHRCVAAVKHGIQQLEQHQAIELLAEDLKQAQNALGEITGEFSADDLLGTIFSEFCIGK